MDQPSLTRTARWISACVWADALVVMALSAHQGAATFVALGESRGAGLATALAVDVALCVALIGDRQLHRLGQRAAWGTVLRWATALLALTLNCGASVAAGQWAQAGLHAIPPLLIILLTEAAQAYQAAFAAALRAQETALAVPAPQRKPARPAVPRREPAPAPSTATPDVTPAVVATVDVEPAPARPHLVSDGGRQLTQRQLAERWLTEQRAAGRDMATITGPELEQAIGAQSGYGRKLLARLEVRAG